MSGYAWVTLATNDSYSLGALVLAHSLRKSNTAHKLAVLITPAVSQPLREQLQTVFNVVKVVDVLDSKDEAHLALMKRPELGITFTKIHCWRLTEFEKCVFLDADTLVVRNCDELFEREEFSAAPDVSWPDCFNSGVFVYRPSIETFNKLLQFAVEKGSFDGGDQGLLNQFFSDWATEDIKKHLPFVYNLTSVAVYSYIPAFKQYGSETRIVHFIGTGKPWLQQLDPATRTITPTSGSEHLTPLLQQWWDLFCEKVHPNLDKSLENANGMSHTSVEACSNSVADECKDEREIPRLLEPYTPYIEKNDFRQYNLPYQPFDVIGASGELLNVGFLTASVAPPTVLEESVEEQQRQSQELEKVEEKDDSDKKDGESGNNRVECQDKNDNSENKFQEPPRDVTNVEINFDRKEFEEENQQPQEETNQQPQEEMEPSKDPFDYHTFFPDETCVNDYLDQNVMLYQVLDNNYQDHCNDRRNSVNGDHNNNRNKDQASDHHIPEETPSLPRFLTIPENDKRQSGNQNGNQMGNQRGNERCVLEEKRFQNEEPVHQPVSQPKESSETNFTEQFNDDSHIPTQERERIEEKHELHKSKSMSFLGSDFNTVVVPQNISFWKSQPNVNVDPNKKYSMPKLKPILPRQNSKSIPSFAPKVTLYTELLMSSEYKDPVDIPKDKVGFVESQILREAHLKKSKSDVEEKFGPLPYLFTWSAEKPMTPKQKMPLRHLDNDAGLYDLSHCKRQMGNKPKPKTKDRKKENNSFLPALKPLVPAKGKKSTVRKRKSKELASSPGDGEKEKRVKRENGGGKERKKTMVPAANIYKTDVSRNSNNVDEILTRLFNFSKDYQHYFGVVSKKVDLSAPTSTDSGSEERLTLPEADANKLERDGEPEQNGINRKEWNKNAIIQAPHVNEQPKTKSRQINLEMDNDLSKTYESFSEVKNVKSIETQTVNGTLVENSLKESVSAEKSKVLQEELLSEDKVLRDKICNAKFTDVRIPVEDEVEAAEKVLANSEKLITNSIRTEKEEEGKIQQIHSYNSKIPVEEKISVSRSVPDVTETESSETKLENGVHENSKASVNVEVPSVSQSNEEIVLKNKRLMSPLPHCQNRASTDLTENEDDQCKSLEFQETTTSENINQRGDEETSTYLTSTMDAERHSEDLVSGYKSNNVEEGNTTNYSTNKRQTDTAPNDETKEESEIKNQEEFNICENSEPSREKSLSLDSEHKCELNLSSTYVREIISEVLERAISKSEVGYDEVSKNEAEEAVIEINGANNSHQTGDVYPDNVQDQKTRDDELEGKRRPNSNFPCEKPDKVEEILCVPEFETPRSSRVMPTSVQEDSAETTRETISEIVEEIIVKAVYSKEISKTLEIPEETPQTHSPTHRKGSLPALSVTPKAQAISSSPKTFRTPSQKPKSSPRKHKTKSLQNGFGSPEEKPKSVTENYKKSEKITNGFDGLSNGSSDAPDNSPRRKSLTKKSAKQSPAKISLLHSNNVATSEISNMEDVSASESAIVQERTSRSGIAGAIAQLSLESGGDPNSQPSAAASSAHQEYIRRQNWETGNMDYMGKDSFDNIWSKICQTLEGKTLEEVGGSSEAPTQSLENRVPTTAAANQEQGKPPATGEPEKSHQVPDESKTDGKTISLSTILQNPPNDPEFIETLPPEVVSGFVEDDEIIFSKSPNQQAPLKNIVEEASPVNSKAVANVVKEEAGNVKLSDILGSGKPDTSSLQEGKQVSVVEKLVTPEVTKEEEKKKAESTEAQKMKGDDMTQAKPPTQPEAPKNVEGTEKSTSDTPVVKEAKLPNQPESLKTVEGADKAPTDAAGIKNAQPSNQPEGPKNVEEAQKIQTDLVKVPETMPLSQSDSAKNVQGPEKASAEVTEIKEAKPSNVPEEPKNVVQEQKAPTSMALVPVTKPSNQSEPCKDVKGGAEKASLKAKQSERTKPQQEPLPTIPLPDCSGHGPADIPASEGKVDVATIPEPKLEPTGSGEPSSGDIQTKTQDAGAKTSGSDPVKDEGKQKKGVFTKILEIVGVSPKGKNGNGGDVSKSVFYDVENAAPPLNEGQPKGQEVPQSSEKPDATGIAQTAENPELNKKENTDVQEQSDAVKTGSVEITEPVKVESKTEKAIPSSEAKPTEKEKAENVIPNKDLPSELQSIAAKEEPKTPKPSEGDEKKQDGKETKQLPMEEKKTPNEKKVEEKVEPSTTPSQGTDPAPSEKTKSIPKPLRNSSSTEKKSEKQTAESSEPPKQPPSDVSPSDVKPKPPSPKLSILPKPEVLPGTTITMPTPPPVPNVLEQRKDLALLAVDETILNTPPVPEAAKDTPNLLKQGETKPSDEGKVKSEIDEIIGKAKSEVESRLQAVNGKSAEKQSAGETAEEGASNLITAMKLIVADDQKEEVPPPPPKKGDKDKGKSEMKGQPASKPSRQGSGKKPKNEKPQKKPEEVEELKVTSEEERKKHKAQGQGATSKLSDQILKAIPPPRRKAISDSKAEASSSGSIPKATPLEAVPSEAKNINILSDQPAEDIPAAEEKPAKSSSGPVPPPRNRPKPSQPTPPKGKTKK